MLLSQIYPDEKTEGAYSWGMGTVLLGFEYLTCETIRGTLSIRVTVTQSRLDFTVDSVEHMILGLGFMAQILGFRV